MSGSRHPFSPAFLSGAGILAVLMVIGIETLLHPFLRAYTSHEVDATLLALEKKGRHHTVVLLGDSVGRGVFADWQFREGSIARLACNQATETAGNYFFLKRYLRNNPPPGAVILADRSPIQGNLDQNLTENYVQRCFTHWSEILEVFKVKLDPVFSVKMVTYKLLATFKFRLHLQQKLVGFTNSDIYSGMAAKGAATAGAYGLIDLAADAIERWRHEPASLSFLRKMTAELRENDIPLHYLPPPTADSNQDAHRLVADTLAGLSQRADQLRGLHVVDGASTRLPASNFSDMVHLNANGLATYRPRIEERVETILSEARERQNRRRAQVFSRGERLYADAARSIPAMLQPLADTTVSRQGESLLVASPAKDPALLLPELVATPIRKNGALVFRIILRSEGSTVARIYYAGKDDPFLQQRSVRAPVAPGTNTLYFALPGEFGTGKVRFDPGETTETYGIDAVEGRIIAGEEAIFF